MGAQGAGIPGGRGPPGHVLLILKQREGQVLGAKGLRSSGQGCSVLTGGAGSSLWGQVCSGTGGMLPAIVLGGELPYHRENTSGASQLRAILQKPSRVPSFRSGGGTCLFLSKTPPHAPARRDLERRCGAGVGLWEGAVHSALRKGHRGQVPTWEPHVVRSSGWLLSFQKNKICIFR